MQIPYNHKNTMWCYIYQYEKKLRHAEFKGKQTEEQMIEVSKF